MLLLLSLATCQTLLMMLLLPLILLVHLVSFIEEHIASAARFSGVEIPVTKTPIGKTHGYPDLTGLKEKLLEDDYIILDDDLCRERNECADSDPAAIKKLLAKHSLK